MKYLIFVASKSLNSLPSLFLSPKFWLLLLPLLSSRVYLNEFKLGFYFNRFLLQILSNLLILEFQFLTFQVEQVLEEPKVENFEHHSVFKSNLKIEANECLIGGFSGEDAES